jgi:polar amino acid transport system permease protein
MSWDLVWTSNNWSRLLFGDIARGEPGGLLLTLALGVVGIVFSTILGALIGVMRTSRSRLVYVPATIYVLVLRNIPLLILVFWAYFVPPYLGLEISKFTSVAIALILFTGAYVAEIVRGGIRSVARGNIEGARALGLSNWEIQLWVVLPQAFYKMSPALTGRYITVVKNTSLAFLIGLTDLTEIGKEINARLMTAPVEVYATLLIIYFVVNRSLSAGTRWLERLDRFNRIFMRI